MTVKVWTSPSAPGWTCSRSPVPASVFWRLWFSSLMLWSQCEKMTSLCMIKYWSPPPHTHTLSSSWHIDQESCPLLSQQRLMAESLLHFQTSHLVRGKAGKRGHLNSNYCHTFHFKCVCLAVVIGCVNSRFLRFSVKNKEPMCVTSLCFC